MTTTLASKTETSQVHHSSMNRRRARPDLILKHEILSEECDLFRASLPNRLYVNRVARMLALVLVCTIGHFYFEVNNWIVSALLMVLVLIIIYLILSQSIEERILFIRGLGVQYTTTNGFNQETCTFYSLPRIKSVYIFESFDGLKTGHFFNVQLEENAEDVVLFEGMRPPVEFLRRVYRKFQELTK